MSPSQPQQAGHYYEYRVVNAQHGKLLSPSSVYATLVDAREAVANRLERWPEDGPQKIQCRLIPEWRDMDPIFQPDVTPKSRLGERP